MNWIVLADQGVVVVNKPAGLLSVPGRDADKQDCAASRVQAQWPDALVVHRLDMATSGLLVFARGIECQRRLSADFAARRVHKIYIAVVGGVPEADTGVVDLPLAADWPARPRQKVDRVNGKASCTHWRVLQRDRQAQRARLALEPVTGRSHQLRVHLAACGWPIVGDALYGGASAERLMLHACELRFEHPLSGATLHLSAAAEF